MTIIVGETERAALKQAMARARTHPVPWEMLEGGVVEGTHTVRIEDRSPEHKRPLPEQVALPFGYLVAISFEEQPVGICLHVSGSGPWPKAAEYGGLRDDLYSAGVLPSPRRMDRTFLIDGKPGGLAFNAIWLVEPAVVGNA